MARSINKVILIGNVGKDPETIVTQSGMTITKMTLATSKSYTKKSTGEKVEETQWHRLVAFNKLGEICGQYIKRGSKIYIEGELKYDSYVKDGETKYTTDIIINDMTMLDGKGDGGGNGQSPARSQCVSNPVAQPTTAPLNDQFDDDIPF